MTPAEVEVARRAVACKGWRWMPGMVMRWQDRARGAFGQQVRPDRQRVSEDVDTDAQVAAAVRALPNLTDPATLGCLLALVREAWGSGDAFVYAGFEGIYHSSGDHERCVPRLGHYWHVVAPLALHIGHGATEAEALVAALEAAP